MAPRRRGLVPPKGTGGKGPLRTYECIIWYGRPTGRVVGDTIVLHPRWFVSLKINPQMHICIPLPPPPYPWGRPYPLCTHASQNGAWRLAVALRTLEMIMGAKIDDMSGLSWGRGPLAPLPKYCLCVYNMPGVSTIGRPRLLVPDRAYKLQTYKLQGPSPPFPKIVTWCLQHADIVYN